MGHYQGWGVAIGGCRCGADVDVISGGDCRVPDARCDVADEAVVSFDGATNWALLFSGPGLDAANGQDLEALHVP